MNSSLGRRTTAEGALRGASLTGRTAIVTGANSGIGVETARVLALAGADVVMACRNLEAGREVATRLRATLPKDSGSLEVRALDLADFASVRAFASAFLASDASLQLLVNNAGIMAGPLGQTAQGHELQVGTNHLGPFLLTKLLRPAIERATSARVVVVSSALHTRGSAERLFTTLASDPRYQTRRYTPFGAYGDSKLANVLFARQLARVLPSHVKAYSLHPGVILTNLTHRMGPLGAVFRVVGGPFMKTIAQGASTSIYASVAPEIEASSGAYLQDCAMTASSREGRDERLAAKLWETSEELVAKAG